ERGRIATWLEAEKHREGREWQARIGVLLAERVQPCVPRRTVDLGAGVTMTFSFIPPGSFLMGSPPAEPGRWDDEALHRVTLTEGFWMGVHPVTQAQWQRVTGKNPSTRQRDDWPVGKVSWHTSVRYGR